MKYLLSIIGMIAVLYGLNEWQTSQEVALTGKTKIGVLHQSNRQGRLEPCGCSSLPVGGIGRDDNALHAYRFIHDNQVFYVDAGNMFVNPKEFKPQLMNTEMIKAGTMVEIQNEMKLDVFAPGPADFLLGLDSLKELEKQSDFPFISTNLMTPSGRPFQPYVVKKMGDLRVLFFSLASQEFYKDTKGVVVTDPQQALARWMPYFDQKADVMVALSQLDIASTMRFYKNYPKVHVIVGADPSFSSKRAIKRHNGFVLENENFGYSFQFLTLYYNFPFTGFKKKGQAIAENESFYTYETMSLTDQDFGTHNKVFDLIQSNTQKIKDAALAE